MGSCPPGAGFTQGSVRQSAQTNEDDFRRQPIGIRVRSLKLISDTFASVGDHERFLADGNEPAGH